MLATLFVIVVALLWEPTAAGGQNIALQVPVVLDLLLLAALFNAVRRSAVTRQTAFIWFAYAFIALAVTDGLVTYLVDPATPRAPARRRLDARLHGGDGAASPSPRAARSG